MAKTDQHAWTVPEKGDEDYESTFNSFFDELDTDVEIRDVDTNKSNYDPTNNAKFFATDTAAVYIGDGNSWNQLSTSGTDTHVDVEDDGSSVLQDVGTLNLSTNLTATASGSTVTVTASGGSGDLGAYVATGGNLQSTLNSAETDGVTTVYADASVSTFQTQNIRVPNGITLDGQGATLQLQSDDWGFFLEPGATLKNFSVDASGLTTWTHAGVQIDTERAADFYGGNASAADEFGARTVNVGINGAKDNGIGVLLYTVPDTVNNEARNIYVASIEGTVIKDCGRAGLEGYSQGTGAQTCSINGIWIGPHCVIWNCGAHLIQHTEGERVNSWRDLSWHQISNLTDVVYYVRNEAGTTARAKRMYSLELGRRFDFANLGSGEYAIIQGQGSADCLYRTNRFTTNFTDRIHDEAGVGANRVEETLTNTNTDIGSKATSTGAAPITYGDPKA